MSFCTLGDFDVHGFDFVRAVEAAGPRIGTTHLIMLAAPTLPISNNPVYFTIAANVGNRDPYGGDFDDVIDISGDIVVWEGRGDIYGADISDLKNIKVFGICLDAARQFDPAICGNLVTWTDERNDKADIYGADISAREKVRVFPIVKADGEQHQPAIDGRTVVYVDDGQIKVCCLSKKCTAIQIPLGKTEQGSGPAISGKTIVWQTSSSGKTCAKGI